MKTTKIFAYACAIALVSTVGFTSCKKDDPAQGTKTNGEAVKTEFSIALPKQLAKKRMPGTTVQRDASEFQGIADPIILVPFAKTSAITSSDIRLGDNVTLGEGVSKTDVDANLGNAKVYEDVSIPLSTGSFLFYGKSAKSGTKFEIGSLNATNVTNTDQPADFSFNLEPIVANASTLTAAESAGGKLLAYLTSIAAATDGGDPAKAWYEYTEGDDPALAAMFATFSTMHGLSSFEVERVLTDLYKSLKPLSSGIATGIKDAINNATYASVNASTDEVELIAALDNFPQENNLPVGSIDIQWNGTSHAFTVGTYSGMAAPDRYVYPAQLWYYGNSAIKTSNVSQKTAYETASNDWDAILARHDGASAVNTRTRAVAITNPIQYAVGRLDVQVKVNAATLADNSVSVEGVATDIDCNAEGFPVTAILIGGQKNVGFDFTPKGDIEYTIYDNVMTSTVEATPVAMKASTSLSEANSTLVLETAASTNVRIAVELENNTGVDFYGQGGQLIPKNGKFYVVAELDPSTSTETDNKVFKQDFTTTARLNLKSLKNAYNTIPDLRTPQLELGFSVDLSWQSGHTYSIDIE